MAKKPPRNPSIDELRHLVRQRHRAATRKVSRLKVSHDVEISGTEYDPRRDLSKLKRYTTSQLRGYLNDLNGFTSRETQFVGDYRRKPIPASSWQTYKALEAQYNRRVQAKFSQIADVFLPIEGMTVAQRRAMVTPLHPQMGDPAVNSPVELSRLPRSVTSSKSLRVLIADMRKRLAPDYFTRLTQSGRNQFRSMVSILNEPELADAADTLSDEVFDLLWNYTNLATASSLFYQMSMAQLSDRERPYHSDIFDQSIRDARALIEWAKSLSIGR